MSGSAFVQIGWAPLFGTYVITQVAGREPGICKGVLYWGFEEESILEHGCSSWYELARASAAKVLVFGGDSRPAAMASGVCGFGAA